MNFKTLRVVERLFAQRLDAFVVACLAEGPLRYGELVYELTIQTQARVYDQSFDRCRRRLLRADVISQIDDDDHRHARYALTSVGQARARMIRAITAAVEDCQRRAAPQPPAAPGPTTSLG